MLGGEPTRLLRPTRWAPLLLPALQFQSFRSKSLQSFLSFSFFTYSKIEEIQVFAKSRIPVCWEGSLLGYGSRPAGRHFCFQLFNFNRFGPNHSRVFFHFRFSLIQKLRRYKFCEALHPGMSEDTPTTRLLQPTRWAPLSLPVLQ